MTKESQRIAIAEACGKFCSTYTPSKEGLRCVKCEGLPFDYIHTRPEALPDYLNDLNAMHEAEEELNEEYQKLYVILLLHGGTGKGEVMACWHCLHATAAQRAEAFLRTVGKWDDSK